MEVFKKILQFFRTRMPIICVVVFGLCWLADYMNGEIHGHHFDGQPDSFWKVLSICSGVMLVNGVVFIISFSAFMLVKPLPEKHKVLRFILRLIIAAAVSFFFCLCSYISVGAFYGFGG